MAQVYRHVPDQPRALQKIGVREFLVLAIGFGCMVGYSRMLSLGFVGYLHQGVYESSDAWHVLRVGANVVALVLLAFAGWKRRFAPGAAGLMIATACSIASAIVFAVDATGAFGWVVALLGGASIAVVMWAWMLVLSSYDVQAIVITTFVGLAVSGAIIMDVPHIDAAYALVIAVATAFVAGAAAVMLHARLHACVPDGPLGKSEAARVPWLTVVVVLLCGFLATVLYGIAQQLTWLYNWSPNYVAFALGIACSLALTVGLMLRSRSWMHRVWAPSLLVLVLALLFSCFSVRDSIQIGVGLVLAAVFCGHYLVWVVFPALFSTLRIPRAFLAAVVLICANASLASDLGDALGSVLPHSMQNLGGVSGVMIIILVVAFGAVLAGYHRAFGTLGLFSRVMTADVKTMAAGDAHPAPAGEAALRADGDGVSNALAAADARAGAAMAAETVAPAGARATAGTGASAGSGAFSKAVEGIASSASAATDVSAEVVTRDGSAERADPGELAGSIEPADSAKPAEPAASAEAAHPAAAPEALDPLRLLQARVDVLTSEYGLTPRESEVGFLTVQGFSCNYIAEKLFVSESTVRFHQRNLYKKLDVHSRNELIEFVNETE